jgi:hypothetical protein
MRLSLLLVFALVTSRLMAGPMPAELAAALKDFRTEGPRGWAFTQTSTAKAHSRVEQFNPAGRGSVQWTLVQQDGRPPTEEEMVKYKELKARRSSNENAPNVKNQINPDSCEILSESAEQGVYRFQLKTGDKDDQSAAFMRVTYTLHRPTQTIEKIELASTEPFSPVFMVKVEEARTVMTYTRPDSGRPSLLKEVTVKIRGRAMWMKSLDEDMTVSYSDYVYAGKK